MKTKSVAGIFVLGSLCLIANSSFAELKTATPKTKASVSTAHEKILPVEDANALVFVELTKAELYGNSRHSGLLPLIDFSSQLYALEKKQGVSRTRGFWRTLMKQAADKYLARTECSGTDPIFCAHESLGLAPEAARKHGLYTLLEFLPAPGGDDPVPALNEIRGAGLIAIEIIRQANQSETALSLWQRIDLVVHQIEEITRKDADFASAYNLTIGQELGVFAQVSAEENIISYGDGQEKSLDLSTIPDAEKANIRDMRKFAGAYLQSHLETDGTFSLKLAELRDRSTDSAFDHLMKNVDEKRRVVDASAHDGKKRSLTLVNSLEHRMFLQTARSTFSILAGLTETLSPRSGFAANSLSAASAASHLSEAMEAYVFEISGAPHPAANVTATTPLVRGSATALDEMFARLLTRPAPDQLSLDHLNLVSKQTLAMLTTLKSKIENLDPALAPTVTDLEAGAYEVGAQLAGVSANEPRIQAMQRSLKNHLDGLDGALLYLPTGTRVDAVKEISLACLAADPFLAQSDFINCVRHFNNNGSVASRDTSVAGEFLAMYGTDGKRADVSSNMFATLGNALAHGIWANIQPLSQFAAARFTDTSLLGSSRGKVGLANAIEWSIQAGNALELAAAHPDLTVATPLPVRSAIDQLLATGSAIDTALIKLGQNGDHATSAIYGSLEAYREILRETRNEMHEQQLRYEAQSVINGYSLDTDAKNLVGAADRINVATRAIGPCDRNYRIAGPNGQQPLLVFPHDFADQLPNGVHLIERLGVGHFEVCYERVGWVPTRQSFVAWFTPGTPPVGLSKLRVVSGEYSPAEFSALTTEYLNDGGRVDLQETKSFGIVSVQLRGSVALGSAAAGRRIELFNVSVAAPMSQEMQFRSVVYGAKIEDLKKRTSADPNEWVNTFPAGRGVWTNENIGEGLNGRSALEDELMKRWAAPSGLGTAFSTLGVPAATAPGMREVDLEIENLFDGQRSEFVRQLDEKSVGDTKLSQRLKDLAGAKALLRSYLTLAFPNAIQGDDDLKHCFSSAFGLPEASEVLKSTHAFSAAGRTMARDTDDQAAVQSLELKIDNLVRSQNTLQKDRIGFIAETLSNLELFKTAQARTQPSVPVEQALENLKRKVQAIAL